MAWEVLSIIGIVAFAISGAIVAMEEEYDILGVYILGIVTAFGGGAIRNLLIGLPVSALWSQGKMFTIALVSITIVFLFQSFCSSIGAHGEFLRCDRFSSVCDSRRIICCAKRTPAQCSYCGSHFDWKRRRNCA